MRVMITGGLGFIGSNLILYWLNKYPRDTVFCIDAVTYAARPEWLHETLGMRPEMAEQLSEHIVDINDHASVVRIMAQVKPDLIIHLAAESHVCRSIAGPKAFVNTNVLGTFHLLEECRALHEQGHHVHFHHVSTDEVFGQLGRTGHFDEGSLLQPRSPYAATKAASDLLVNAYAETYGLHTTISNCSNNFGPNQHEEKLIPKAIMSALRAEPMTVYGTGQQVRDWLWVEDHCRAIDTIIRHGELGTRYCVGGNVELTNRAVIDMVRATLERLMAPRKFDSEIVHTQDRPTDDFRYAVDSSALMALGWTPGGRDDFEARLTETVEWYLDRFHFVEKM